MKNYIVFRGEGIAEHELCKQIQLENNKVIVSSVKCAINIIYDNFTGSVDIEIENNSIVELIETYRGECKFKKNILVSKNATLEKITFNEATETNINEIVDIKSGAAVDAAFAQLSDGNVRDECIYNLLEENAFANVTTTGISREKQSKIMTVKIIHKAPYTTGNIDNFGISKDISNIVFNGWGVIEKGMIKSKATQQQKIIIFDEKSRGEANPFLLIDENDVEASHAAGIGQMNREHLYYLQTRGLSEMEAKKLISIGHITPLVEKIKNKEMREIFLENLEKKVK